ncbi:hypothetical protein Z955_14075, partial [Clostridium botulinum C/D str. DC5]
HADDTSGVFFQFCQLALDSIKFQGENNTKISAMSILHSFASIRGTKISNVKYGIECLSSVVVKSDDLVFTNCQSQYVTSQGGKISNVKYGIECLSSVVVKSDDLVFTNCQSQYVTSQGGKIFHS